MIKENNSKLTIVKSHELDYLDGMKTPPISKEMIYKFLDTNYAYHHTNGGMQIDPALEQQLKTVFPNLDIREKYQPNNYGWYQQKLNKKVSDQESRYSNDSDTPSHILEARQQRAADIMTLVYQVLLKNDVAPETAQLISFQTVSKALDKNPNLILNNELDVQKSDEITKNLDNHVAMKLKPEFEENNSQDNTENEPKYLTEESGIELQAYLTNQMVRQMDNYNRSSLNETMKDGVGYIEKAYDEASELHASTSLELKNNIKNLRKQFFTDSKQPTNSNTKKWQPPTPFDDLDPYNRG